MELSLRKKRILKFSIVYWLVVAFILTIFGLSFSKVPIGDYGLKANYFSPSIDRNYYLPGLYDISIGNYFILFPSTRQYLRNRTLQVTNQNQQRVTITYTLAYKYIRSQVD